MEIFCKNSLIEGPVHERCVQIMLGSSNMSEEERSCVAATGYAKGITKAINNNTAESFQIDFIIHSSLCVFGWLLSGGWANVIFY